MGDGLRRQEGWVLSTKVGRLRRRPDGRRPRSSNDLLGRAPPPWSLGSTTATTAPCAPTRTASSASEWTTSTSSTSTTSTPSRTAKTRRPRMHREAMDGAYRALEELPQRRRQQGDRASASTSRSRSSTPSSTASGTCFLLAGRYTLLEQEPLADPVTGGRRSMARLDRDRRAVQLRHPRRTPDLELLKAPAEVLERVRAIARSATPRVALAAAAMQFPGPPAGRQHHPRPRARRTS